MLINLNFSGFAVTSFEGTVLATSWKLDQCKGEFAINPERPDLNVISIPDPFLTTISKQLFTRTERDVSYIPLPAFSSTSTMIMSDEALSRSANRDPKTEIIVNRLKTGWDVCRSEMTKDQMLLQLCYKAKILQWVPIIVINWHPSLCDLRLCLGTLAKKEDNLLPNNAISNIWGLGFELLKLTWAMEEPPCISLEVQEPNHDVTLFQVATIDEPLPGPGKVGCPLGGCAWGQVELSHGDPEHIHTWKLGIKGGDTAV
ncbi:hypothetical protein Cgig2_024504 [Carnegiea gigantea]|uniref:Uncharacterized protein n=1 Tax=Carnegiea gigantea TaxID=171969 RepID=A0A9Q1KKZ1_9CARY|nr:hypothetical protein Cgig2_024504 [Carnegiea gigantea]